MNRASTRSVQPPTAQPSSCHVSQFVSNHVNVNFITNRRKIFHEFWSAIRQPTSTHQNTSVTSVQTFPRDGGASGLPLTAPSTPPAAFPSPFSPPLVHPHQLG